MADLTTKYLGFELKNPVIIGSSGLTDSVDKIKKLEDNGAGAVSLKSIFEEEITLEYEADVAKAVKEGSYSPERFDYYDFHIKKENLKNYFKLISDAKKSVNIPVFASINCRTSYEWPQFAKEFVDAGADALELNVFILPSDIEKSQEEIEKTYFDIIEKVKKEVKIPVSLKISYYFSNLASMIKRLSETDIEGLILFNRFYSPDYDIDNLKVLSSHVLSSPDELPISLRWIAIMSNKVNCDLVASTGIHDGKAIVKQFWRVLTQCRLHQHFTRTVWNIYQK
jgi:dihydroorotate dehydrogenase (fumarate)